MGKISKKTLAVLVIIAIVISAVATWKMLSTPSIVFAQGGEGKAYVSFGVGATAPDEPVQKSGQNCSDTGNNQCNNTSQEKEK